MPRIVRVVRRDVPEALQQVVGVVFDRADAVGAEQRGKDALHDRAVFQDVADAAGRAAVVFQDVIAAVFVANQVGAADVDVDVVGGLSRRTSRGETSWRRRSIPAGRSFFFEDALIVVDVLAEKVQGGDALDEAALDDVPFVGGDDARDEVEGENLFDAARVAVDGEGDALVAEKTSAIRRRRSNAVLPEPFEALDQARNNGTGIFPTW